MSELKLSRHQLVKNRESFWYAEPSREALLKELHDLTTDPSRHRTRSIAIVGDKNDGKSQIIKQFLQRHPKFELGDLSEIPAIAIEMSDIETIQQLSRRFLEEIRAVAPESGTHEERMKRFFLIAKTVGLRMIFLDEFHDCADTTGKGKPFLRIIKSLLLKHFFVVPVGVAEVEEVLKKDPQLANRFNFKRGRLSKVHDVAVIKSLAEKIAGRDDIQITNAALKQVLVLTSGNLGDILDLVEETLRNHNAINVKTIAKQKSLMSFS